MLPILSFYKILNNWIIGPCDAVNTRSKFDKPIVNKCDISYNII